MTDFQGCDGAFKRFARAGRFVELALQLVQARNVRIYGHYRCLNEKSMAGKSGRVLHLEGFWLRREKSVENSGHVTSLPGESLPPADFGSLAATI